ncbi:MAG: hypothetical protein BAJALOKI2v1_270032 [Promethearchaeota archaeon]|nr:MAG: hypothetical protein BAJALOKI2v1_270032 [Candidatus Lokiarchaeota archaeon]
MNLKIPRKNDSEFLFYIWKIIDLPEISFQDLLYTISFDLFLMSPEKTRNFIQTAIKNEKLIKDSKNMLTLSPVFQKKLNKWQKIRKQEILKKISQSRNQKRTVKSLSEDKATDFNTLINAFSDKATLNRAVTVSDASINLIKFDENEGMILANISGSKDEPYKIKIDTNQNILEHDCHDFVQRRALNKKFCKHLVKLFLVLKSKNEKVSISFLKKISKNINNWEFTE